MRRHPAADRTEPGDPINGPTILTCEPVSGTAEYDRGEKLAHYQRIPSLREVGQPARATLVIENQE